MYKIIGVSLLSVGGFLCARIINKKEERTLTLTNGWISFIRYVKNQIECFGIPIEKILSECDVNLLEKIEYQGKIPPKDFSELLAGASLPNKDTGAMIIEFTREFGRYYREEQLKRCNYYLSALEERRIFQNEKLPEKKRMNYTLWLSGCLALGILLL